MIFALGCYKYCNSHVHELLGIKIIIAGESRYVKKISRQK